LLAIAILLVQPWQRSARYEYSRPCSDSDMLRRLINCRIIVNPVNSFNFVFVYVIDYRSVLSHIYCSTLCHVTLNVVLVAVQLDHTVSVEALEKMTIYFRQLYNVFLAQEKPDCTSLLSNHTYTLMAATNCLVVDVLALKFSVQVAILYSFSMFCPETLCC